MDVAMRLISLDDDPTLPAFTFRMWFLGIGLACFGSVLGQIFVRVFILAQMLQFICYQVFSSSDDICQPSVPSNSLVSPGGCVGTNHSRAWPSAREAPNEEQRVLAIYESRPIQ